MFCIRMSSRSFGNAGAFRMKGRGVPAKTGRRFAETRALRAAADAGGLFQQLGKE